MTEMDPDSLKAPSAADTAFVTPVTSNAHVHPAADERPGVTWARLQDPAEYCVDPECPFNTTPWEEWASK